MILWPLSSTRRRALPLRPIPLLTGTATSASLPLRSGSSPLIRRCTPGACSDGLGSLIELTPAEYFSTYVFNTDYTQAPEIGVDRILQSGNALENLTEAYPGCRFVEFHFPGLDPANAGLDWCSLKLVFSPSDSCWQLVGIIHSQWTI